MFVHPETHLGSGWGRPPDPWAVVLWPGVTDSPVATSTKALCNAPSPYILHWSPPFLPNNPLQENSVPRTKDKRRCWKEAQHTMPALEKRSTLTLQLLPKEEEFEDTLDTQAATQFKFKYQHLPSKTVSDGTARQTCSYLGLLCSHPCSCTCCSHLLPRFIPHPGAKVNII